MGEISISLEFYLQTRGPGLQPLWATSARERKITCFAISVSHRRGGRVCRVSGEEKADEGRTEIAGRGGSVRRRR